MMQRGILLKESEVTRLQAKISSLERAAERQNPAVYNTLSSLSSAHPLLHPQEDSSSSHCPSSSPKMRPVNSISPPHTPWTSLPCQTKTSPPSDAGLQLLLQSCSNDLSLELPPSLKRTLREALNQQPWESSCSDTIDPSWQGLSSTEPSSSCEISFDPLTYMVGETISSTEGTMMEEEDGERVGPDTPGNHTSSLAGMLRFVNQTLANQKDPSLWSSPGSSQSGHSLQMDAKEA